MATTSQTTSPTSTSTQGQVIVDLGEQRRKRIRQLSEGRGKLLDEVNRVVQELKTAGTLSASAQPVIIVVREAPRARGGIWPLM